MFDGWQRFFDDDLQPRAEMAKQRKGYTELNRKKSVTAVENVPENPRTMLGSRRLVDAEAQEERPASRHETEETGPLPQFSQKWANSHAMASAKDDAEKQKVSAMLENLKRMM